MGRQSARIYFQGKDHKEIYFNGRYHKALHIGDKLAWEKIETDEGVYNVYAMVHTQGLYFALVLKKEDDTPYLGEYQTPYLLVGASLKNMKAVHRDKYKDRYSKYANYLRNGCYYMGYTESEVYIIWNGGVSNLFEINNEATEKNAPAERIYTPIPGRVGDTGASNKSGAMGVITENGRTFAWITSEYISRNSTHIKNTGYNAASGVREATGVTLLDNGYIYFMPSNYVSISVKYDADSESWSYDEPIDMPDWFLRFDTSELDISFEKIHINDLDEIFQEYFLETLENMLPGIAGRLYSITLSIDASALIKVDKNTVLVFLEFNNSLEVYAYYIDLDSQKVLAKYDTGVSLQPKVWLKNAIKIGNEYLLWGTSYTGSLSIRFYKYNCSTHTLRQLFLNEMEGGSPFVPYNYEEGEILKYTNVIYANGNANKLFSYNIESETTTEETIIISEEG